MMQGVIAAMMVVILTAVGVALFRSGTRAYITKDAPFILIHAKNAESIEQTIRRAIRRCPECTIYVTNRSADPEMEKILSILEKEIHQVHVLHYII